MTAMIPWKAEPIGTLSMAGLARIRWRAMLAAIFFPVDGHMPGLQLAGAVLVRKTVVKVPV